MLNYIWAGLIIASLAFALWYDSKDLYHDRYRNQRPLPAVLVLDADVDDPQDTPARLVVDAGQYARHFGVEAAVPQDFPVRVTQLQRVTELRFAADAKLPEPLATIARETHRSAVLIASVEGLASFSAGEHAVRLAFEPVRFVKLKAIAAAAFHWAQEAFTLALSLVGALALWLGLMKIAEASGLIAVFVTLVQPILRPLFPQIPRGHPAMGMIALNLTANMLGLGNAATPLGLKAMEELQKLNPTDDTATDPMVMLLALNTASVQLIPPATLVAVLGLGVAEVFVPILIVTAISLGIAILSAKLLGALPRYRSTNPNLPTPAGGR